MLLYFNDRIVGFGFSHTQRCYTISQCWNDHSENAQWEKLPGRSEMAFFADEHCQGPFTSSARSFLNFSGTKLHNTVSSFMVIEHKYPVNGIVDLCHESALLTTTNSSTSRP
ncbi:hypothetical protein PHYBOEH_009078 [Phytophthora boehmeriae]|uniref:Uncharacterized protein n=1 Tax=Phytophthora boehmeriae TaxID=109152 RepID=A0A8T1VVY0_9STRA|nr:hypothetical protein PHYBOEH_009078 [Phytophthora boehmeriae]